MDDKHKLRTAVLWSEEKPVKAGVKVAVEQVRVFNGWQGTKGWADPE